MTNSILSRFVIQAEERLYNQKHGKTRAVQVAIAVLSSRISSLSPLYVVDHPYHEALGYPICSGTIRGVGEMLMQHVVLLVIMPIVEDEMLICHHTSVDDVQQKDLMRGNTMIRFKSTDLLG